MRPKAYLETTILSYLGARPTQNIVVAAHQKLTKEWWRLRRGYYELFVSELVVEEATKGDREAAHRRHLVVEQCRVLGVESEALELAEFLVQRRCVPRKAAADALHISIATVNEMDYLVTWNCSHINNAALKQAIESACLEQGYRPPIICTPEELMGDQR